MGMLPHAPGMANAVAGFYTYAEFAACALAFLPVMGLSHLRHTDDPTQRLPGRWLRRFGRMSGRLTPLWKFKIEGAAPPDVSHRPYVVVANHASVADPFLLSWLPWDMRWVAKQELFDAPVIGWMMHLGGDIPLKRGDPQSVSAMMLSCQQALEGGISVMMFPEGTRSETGDVARFKDGAFLLAIRAKVPVLPIALIGTREMRPKHSTWFGKAQASALVLPPLSTDGLGEGDVPALRDRCRDAIARATARESARLLGRDGGPSRVGA